MDVNVLQLLYQNKSLNTKYLQELWRSLLNVWKNKNRILWNIMQCNIIKSYETYF